MAKLASQILALTSSSWSNPSSHETDSKHQSLSLSGGRKKKFDEKGAILSDSS